MSRDADRKPTVRAQGAHLFLAGCEMCVFRYKQHSSRDKPLGPHPLNPHPPKSLHPPCLLKCVCARVWACACVRVYVERGSAGPVPRHLQGATEKTAVCLRETEKRKEERVEGQQACQSRPSLLEWVPPSLLLSFLLLPSCFISSPVTLALVSSCYRSLPLCFSTNLILLLSLLQCFVFIYKILGFIFSGVVHLPTLPVFIRSVMGHYFSQL